MNMWKFQLHRGSGVKFWDNDNITIYVSVPRLIDVRETADGGLYDVLVEAGSSKIVPTITCSRPQSVRMFVDGVRQSDRIVITQHVDPWTTSLRVHDGSMVTVSVCDFVAAPTVFTYDGYGKRTGSLSSSYEWRMGPDDDTVRGRNERQRQLRLRINYVGV